MNTKWFLIIFLLLSTLIILYPPFHWDADESIQDSIIRMQLPIKQHTFLFGPSTKEFTLEHYSKSINEQKNNIETTKKPDISSYSDEELKLIIGIIPLKRKIALTDFLLEYVIALSISLLVASVHGKMRKKQKET